MPSSSNITHILHQLKQVEYMTTKESKEQLAKIVGEMRETVREKLESMESEGAPASRLRMSASC